MMDFNYIVVSLFQRSAQMKCFIRFPGKGDKVVDCSSTIFINDMFIRVPGKDATIINGTSKSYSNDMFYKCYGKDVPVQITQITQSRSRTFA